MTMSLKEKIGQLLKKPDPLAQELGRASQGELLHNDAMIALCRRAAGQGIVLLKNDGTLPLSRQEQTAFFGRSQQDCFFVGYGSGGDVNAPGKVSPLEALERRGDICFDRELAGSYRSWCAAHALDKAAWGAWPSHLEEMPVSEQQLLRAARNSRCAVVMLGRATGESMDNRLKKGWYYLTDEELSLLDRVTAAFDHTVVVIQAGGILDMQWTKRYGSRISALLYAFHGGMEAGNALIDVLYGDVCPSGKLADTIALRYRDYPSFNLFGQRNETRYEEDIYVGYRYFETFLRSKVLYPFGFGLSYTTFRLEAALREEAGQCQVDVTVTNTGSRAGAEVVQIYVNPPQGKLGKPLRALVDFRRTPELAPGEQSRLEFRLDPAQFASFDDAGITGADACYVLEPGQYQLYVGSDVRSAQIVGSWENPQLRIVERLSHQACPNPGLRRLRPKFTADGAAVPDYAPVPAFSRDRERDIRSHLPASVTVIGPRDIHFQDVCQGKATLDEFVSQLDIRQLDALTRGGGLMDDPFGPAGNAGILGGTTEQLRSLGVPVIVTSDGPAGLRLAHDASLLPCGTALACCWDPALVEQIGTLLGQEMARLGVHILLGPGMNIHRDPLCGRNFEYFSEDPLLTGRMAAAMVRGVQHTPGRSACPKHFACNNQEFNRNRNNSALSERALREIYLRGFEICVRESRPETIMTSYNKINGAWGHYQYDLVTNVLRGEWGYDGLVITDWWMQPATDPDFPQVRNDAYRIRAQVDVLMPGGRRFGESSGDGSLEKSYLSEDGITLGEAQRCAKNVLRLCLRLQTPQA